MCESNTEEIENAVQYLTKVASVLPASVPINFLKSYYLTKCRKLTLSGPVGLPQQFSKTTKRCPRCCVQYEDGPTSYKIEPVYRKNRFMRRLAKKNSNQEHLTNFQRKYLNNLQRKGSINAHNKLEIVCGICNHKTTEKLEKRLDNVPKEIVQIENHKNKKKKKKKDRFSGLNKHVVLSMTPKDKSYNTNEFISLEPSTISKIPNNEKSVGKNLFPSKNQNKTNNQHKRVVHKESIKAKAKQKKQLKGLQSILEKSKEKQSPSVSLKQFLNSL